MMPFDKGNEGRQCVKVCGLTCRAISARLYRHRADTQPLHDSLVARVFAHAQVRAPGTRMPGRQQVPYKRAGRTLLATSRGAISLKTLLATSHGAISLKRRGLESALGDMASNIRQALWCHLEETRVQSAVDDVAGNVRQALPYTLAVNLQHGNLHTHLPR
jgi:hypothetical protein